MQLAAMLFAILTGIAMAVYPGYRFSDQFLSEIGATHHGTAAALFACALVILGLAMVVFAAAWRDYAFGRGRARWLGRASQLCGTLSGLAFVVAACTPIDIALALHNAVVVAAFGLLLAYVATTTILWACNGAPLGVLVAGAAYATVLTVYFGAVGWAVRNGLLDHIRVVIVGQKIVVGASLAYIVYMTMIIRRWARVPAARARL